VNQVILGSEITNIRSVNVTRDHFGDIENNSSTNFGANLAVGTSLDNGLQFLGSTKLRYPGGSDAVDSSWANISGGPTSALYINYIAAIKDAINYCHLRGQGNRVWKSGREDSEHSANCLALSSPSSSGFDDFQSRGDETNPNAIPLMTMEILASAIMACR
jgi:hypothetical protein